MTSDAVALLLLDYMQCSPAAAGLQRCGLASAGLHAMQPCCRWTSTLWPCFCWTTCNAALLLLDFNAVASLLLDYMQCSPAAAGLQHLAGLRWTSLRALQLLSLSPACPTLSWTPLDFTSCAAAAVTQPCMFHTQLDFAGLHFVRCSCCHSALHAPHLAGLRWTSLRALQLLPPSPACPTLG
jgi:hypothetical protein